MAHLFRKDNVPVARDGYKAAIAIRHEDQLALLKRGMVIFDLRCSRTGKRLAYWEQENLITWDAGILGARLFKDSTIPHPTENNGLLMLSVGTGATGNLLSPDIPTKGQRKLNAEIARKAFSSTQYRNMDGVAVSIPTNIVDFTTIFSEGEAVGALNEMGLVSPYSSNPAILNPINNGPSDYDPTIDVTGKDLMANYLTFGVISKPSASVLALTWRLTFG